MLCPSQTKCKTEWNVKREDTEWINSCWTGPFLAFVENADKEDETEAEPESEHSHFTSLHYLWKLHLKKFIPQWWMHSSNTISI